MIPRLLHQTVPDFDAIPSEFLENIQKIKALNPDFTHVVYDDRDIDAFIKGEFSLSIYNYYQQINPVYGPARADFFRYLLLYTYGGVYLDVKSTLNTPLDDAFCRSKYLLAHWSAKHGNPHYGWGAHPEFDIESEFQQWHIVARPRHPFLKAVISEVMWNIDHYRPETHGMGRKGVLRVTGPVAYTMAIKPLLGSYDYEMVDIAERGFQYSIFEGTDQEDRHVHLFGGHYQSRPSEPVVLKAGADW